MFHITSLFVLFVCISPSIAIVKNSFPLSGEREIVKGELLNTLPALGKEWKVSFEVNPRYYVGGWGNILHLWYPSGVNPSGTNYSSVSCLAIGIQSTRTCSWGSCSTKPNRLSYKYKASEHQHGYYHDFDSIPQLHQWTKIEVSQIRVGNSYKIVFNDTAKTRTIWNPKIFEGVEVYASDPWNIAQPGKIRNLRITNLNTGKHPVHHITSSNRLTSLI